MDADFIGNSAGSGGAISVNLVKSVSMQGCTFIANTATDGDGGACSVLQSVLAEFSHCTFHDNKSNQRGGALQYGIVGANERQLLVHDCTIFGNVAEIGGGLFAGNTPFSLVAIHDTEIALYVSYVLLL